MDRTEYWAEYMRLATLGRRNWEALGPLIMEPTSRWSEYVRLSDEEKRLREEQDHLVRHWPEMPSPTPDDD